MVGSMCVLIERCGCASSAPPCFTKWSIQTTVTIVSLFYERPHYSTLSPWSRSVDGTTEEAK